MKKLLPPRLFFICVAAIAALHIVAPLGHFASLPLLALERVDSVGPSWRP